MIGNKFTEKDIRDWLTMRGYFGNSAKFDELELHAIGRPGWIQVFRFTVKAKARDGSWRKLFGCVREDERYSTQEVKVYWSRSEQARRLAQLSEGLLRRQSNRSNAITPLPWVAFYVAVFFGCGYGLLWLLNQVWPA